MRNPQQERASEFTVVGADPPQLAYASDVQISADSGGVQLTFTRDRPVEGEAPAGGKPRQEDEASFEIIARVVLPPLAARRLLRLLPGGLDRQQVLADEYARETEHHAQTNTSHGRPNDPAGVSDDPLLAALAAAEDDDEPYPDEQRAAARTGCEEYVRRETVPWEEVRRELFDADDTSAISKS